MAQLTLSTKGQLVIPREIRDANGWTAGTRFDIEVADGTVTLRAPPRLATTDLRAGLGMLASPSDGHDDASANAAVDAMFAEQWCEE